MRWLRWTDALLLAFIGLAIVVGLAPLNTADLAVSLAVQRLDAADSVLRGVSWFGFWPRALIWPAVAIVALWAIRWRRESVLLATSAVGGFLLCHSVRLLDPRPRPGLPVHIVDVISGSGFPSGHVVDYVAVCGFGWVIVQHRAASVPTWLRRSLLVILGAAVILVGPSRIYLGAHWPTDVLGGYLLGGWWVTVMARLYRSSTWR